MPIIDSPALTKGLPSTPWNTMNMAGREPITKQQVNAGFTGCKADHAITVQTFSREGFIILVFDLGVSSVG